MGRLPGALALAGIAFQIWLVATSWQNLPDRVPTHYGFSGPADAYGGRASVLVLSAVTIGTCVLLAVLRRFPQAFHYPVAVTPENRPLLQAIALWMTDWLMAELAWTFAYLEWTIVREAQGLSKGLSTAFLPLSLGLVAGTIIAGVVRMGRAARR